MLQANTLIRTDFCSFVRKAFRHTHEGTKLGDHAYIDFVCHKLEGLVGGETPRLIINMPPRHLKTFLGAKCLAAWMLGIRPSTNVLIVTYSEALANEIAYGIRSIMQSTWYKAVFKTRLADDRTKVTDFATTQGGRVYAASIDGSITGHGADLLIFDDPIDIDDADNLEHIQKINARFDSKVMSRLNNAKESRVVVIAHRLNEHDLSGHLKAAGGWESISLPMIAKRSKIYDVGYGEWHRKKGDLLRPDAFTKNEIKRLQNTLAPDFETLYQQSPGGVASVRLKRKYFQICKDAPGTGSVILSIDTAQRGGPANSYSTIQAWRWVGPNHYLVGNWREQCNFDRLCERYWFFVRRFRPVVALIEATAMGPQLIADAKRRERVRVLEIIPDSRSKVDRLVAHLRTFKRKHIYLPEMAEWREQYIGEFLQFPQGKFDDQVDATTQYLDWVRSNPVVPTPEPRALGGGVTSTGQPILTTSTARPTLQGSGAVYLARRPFF
jgi:predicted phage terminase large subunit-like protein